MSIDLSGISNATTAATTLGNLILVSPQETKGYQAQNFPSWKQDKSKLPPAFLFDYEGEQSATLTSDITDHFIENNTAIQDQIAQKPIIITTQGFVGELNNIPPAALLPLQIVAEKLTAVGAYAPQISATAALAYAEAAFLYATAESVINSAVSTWASINGGSGESVINGSGIKSQANQTKQQVCFQQFYGYWNSRTLFTIQTPWAIFQDMAIMSLRAVQDAETRMISDFEITFKQLRFASTLTVDNVQYNPNGYTTRLGDSQGVTENNLGTNSLEPSDTSFDNAISGAR